MTTELTFESIAALPKLELHIHLEGCFPLDFVKKKADAKNRVLPRPLDSLFKTKDLSEFLETLDWVCSLVDTEEDARQLALSFGEYCKSQHIVYCELIINPTHWANIHYSKLFPALATGFDEVESTYGIDVRLLPSILRQQSAEDAEALADWIVGAKLPRIAGISIDGNEAAAGPTGARFSSAYNTIREAGLGCTAHAGESSGPDGVLSALDELKVHRIDHGVRVIEDVELTQRLIDHDITLNVCIWSNCHHLYDNIHAHPFLQLFRLGVPVTLNTDDPIALHKTLNEELFWVADHLALTMDDMVKLQKNAINASFCSPEKKKALEALYL